LTAQVGSLFCAGKRMSLPLWIHGSDFRPPWGLALSYQAIISEIRVLLTPGKTQHFSQASG
jgi:hypothetical protein